MGCNERRGADDDGGRFKAFAGVLSRREGVRCRGVTLVVDTVESAARVLLGNDEGGAEMRLLEAIEGLGSADVAFRLLGTTVVTPLATLVRDTMESARGFTAPNDVPAVVERDDGLTIREEDSDGGLTDI